MHTVSLNSQPMGNEAYHLGDGRDDGQASSHNGGLRSGCKRWPRSGAEGDVVVSKGRHYQCTLGYFRKSDSPAIASSESAPEGNVEIEIETHIRQETFELSVTPTGSIWFSRGKGARNGGKKRWHVNYDMLKNAAHRFPLGGLDVWSIRMGQSTG
ncbi:hypothetical protein HU200_044629 [Digitaria exilis]|uniref:Uncharacterized protein n=1 Tax=Digitaria exilis TaxID=1010633 RepID=A0A835B1B8_9POAL|nr:hypothetical protein HU200_044629 [Digitaria exilis]